MAGVREERAWEETGEEISVSLAAVQRELKRVIASGELAPEQQGRRRVVAMGALADWLGQELAPIPEFGRGVSVRPDGEAATVQHDRAAHERAQAVLDRARRLVGPVNDAVDEAPSLADALRDALVRDLNAVWGEVLACEQIARREHTALGVDEGLDPNVEGYLRVAHTLLTEVSDELAAWGISMDDPAPDPALVARLTARIGGD